MAEMRECPYPRCGSDDHVHDLWVSDNAANPGDWSTGCASCGMGGPVCESREKAIAAWNDLHRDAEAAPQPSRDDLGRAAYERYGMVMTGDVRREEPVSSFVPPDAEPVHNGPEDPVHNPAAPLQEATEGDGGDVRIAIKAMGGMANWLDDDAQVALSCEDREVPR